MANEITVTCSLSASKGGATVSSGTATASITMTGIDMAQFTQTITDVEAAIEIPAGLATIGFLMVKNLSATDWVEIYYTTATVTDAMKIPAGGANIMSPVKTTVFGKCDSAKTALIEITAVEV
jgi:hypothetical protein